MTDVTANAPSRLVRRISAEDSAALVRARYGAERRFQAYGLIALAIAFGFLVFLFGSIVSQGWRSFVQTTYKLEVFLDPAVIDPSNTRDRTTLQTADYTALARLALKKAVGIEGDLSRPVARDLNGLLSRGSDVPISQLVLADPSKIGQTVKVSLLAHGNVDALLKGFIDRSIPEDRRQLNDRQLQWVDKLAGAGTASKDFNWGLFTFAASAQPETAGLAAALIGSFFMMLIVALLSVPLGVAAALYLEEFAPKNWFTDIVEVNINNLAAVPSIVFGLLGLAVFINFFGMPRSAALVGGLVLTLQALPTIIIATRASLRAVPPSIKEAALGVGASKMQAIFHHVLPLALPGILTGLIIALVHALGETAPLLMIGLVAFVVDVPSTPLDPATALPVQIYMWATAAERGFVERTAGATMVLLVFLFFMNAIAVYLRRKFERRW